MQIFTAETVEEISKIMLGDIDEVEEVEEMEEIPIEEEIKEEAPPITRTKEEPKKVSVQKPAFPTLTPDCEEKKGTKEFRLNNGCTFRI